MADVSAAACTDISIPSVAAGPYLIVADDGTYMDWIDDVTVTSGSPPGGSDDDTMGVASCILAPGAVSGQSAPGEDGVNSLSADLASGDGWDPLKLFDTDPGHFQFAGDAICTGLDVASEAGNPGPGVFAPVNAQITAAGDYDNLVCGTGTANGEATLTAAAPAAEIHTHFGITFAAGAGKLSLAIASDESGDPPVNGRHPSTQPSYVGQTSVDGGSGQGVIEITPSEGKCTTTNVTSFSVNGAFYTSLSGEGGSDLTAGLGLPGTPICSR